MNGGLETRLQLNLISTPASQLFRSMSGSFFWGLAFSPPSYWKCLNVCPCCRSTDDGWLEDNIWRIWRCRRCERSTDVRRRQFTPARPETVFSVRIVKALIFPKRRYQDFRGLFAYWVLWELCASQPSQFMPFVLNEWSKRTTKQAFQLVQSYHHGIRNSLQGSMRTSSFLLLLGGVIVSIISQ